MALICPSAQLAPKFDRLTPLEVADLRNSQHLEISKGRRPDIREIGEAAHHYGAAFGAGASAVLSSGSLNES